MNNTELTALAQVAFASNGTGLFSVNFWGSNPADDNDDCWTGCDFDTREQAEAFFNNAFAVWAEGFNMGLTRWSTRSIVKETAFIQLDGPGVNKSVANPGFKASKDDGSADRRELAMEAGMLGGCDAYNDAMGF